MAYTGEQFPIIARKEQLIIRQVQEVQHFQNAIAVSCVHYSKVISFLNTIAGSIDACMSIDVFMKIEEPSTALAGEDGETGAVAGALDGRADCRRADAGRGNRRGYAGRRGARRKDLD